MGFGEQTVAVGVIVKTCPAHNADLPVAGAIAVKLICQDPARSSQLFGNEELVDLSSVEIDNLEPVSSKIEVVTDAWQTLELREREPRHGCIITILGQRETDAFGKRIGRKPARHEQAAVLALDQRRIGIDVAIRSEIPCNGGEKIGRRHYPFEMTILIMNHRHWHIGPAKCLERIHRINLIGDNWCLLHQVPQVDFGTID